MRTELLFGEMMRKAILVLWMILSFVLAAGCGGINTQDVTSQVGLSVARRGVSMITPVPATNDVPEEQPVQPQANPTDVETLATEPAGIEEDSDPTPVPTIFPTATAPLLPVPTETSAPSPTESSSPASCSPDVNRTFESEVIQLINQERGKEGFPPLAEQSQLTQAARLHSQDMGCNQFFSHVSPTAGDVTTRVSAQGYSFSAIGENIAAGQTTPASVVQAWMNSTGHRANILNGSYTQIGVGYAYLGGENAGVFWTLLVGAP